MDEQRPVQGKYEIIRRIGVGGMAEVFLARQRGLEGFEKLVVIKRILPRLVEDEEFVRLFLDEARTAADLRHPNVVSVIDVGREGDTYYIVMEYLQGKDLRTLQDVAGENDLPVPRAFAVQFVGDVASGLHYAHTKHDFEGRPLKIVHRDVSPHNILVTYDGVAKIVDFGIAKAASRSHVTQEDIFRGKCGYLSPEQAVGGELDGRSDQFSLGIVLYELTTGQRLFRRDTNLAMVYAVVEGPIPPPSAIDSTYPAELENVVMRMLAREVDHRFADCGAVAAALEDYLAAQRVARSPSRAAHYLKQVFADAIDGERESLKSVGALKLQVSSTSETPSAETPSVIWEKADGPPVIHYQATVAQSRGTPTGSPGRSATIQREALRTNINHVGTQLIGRDADLETLRRTIIDDDQRLVTLLGAGGLGKTRLVLEFGTVALPMFCHAGGGGVWFFDLAETTDIDSICAVVGQGLSVPLTAGQTRSDTVRQLGHAMAARGKALLIFDNFEQIAPFAEATLGRFREFANEASFLVTSRVLVDLPEECLIDLEPLDQARVEGQASAAMQLFYDRAQAVRRNYRPDETQDALVAEIVAQLDGIPLAIELAAARMRVMSAKQLLERLPRRFDLLAKQSRGKESVASRRQDTLRDAIAWSYTLLKPWERATLEQCAVFRGGFSLEAAEAVLDLSGHEPAPWALDALHGLRDKSFLRIVESDGPQEIRFSQFISIREYCAEQLDASNGKAAAEARHAEYFCRRGKVLAEGAAGHGGAQNLQAIAADRENLMAITHRSFDGAAYALEAALVLDPLLTLQGPFGGHRQLLDDVLGRADHAVAEFGPLLAQTYAARGQVHQVRGDLEASRADFEKAIAFADQHGVKRVVARANTYLAAIDWLRGDLQSAATRFPQAMAQLKEAGDRETEGRAIWVLGLISQDQGGFAQAREHFEQALAIHRELGNRPAEGEVLGNLANLHLELGELDLAKAAFDKALAVLNEVGDRRFIGLVLGGLGVLAQERGDMQRAESYYQASVASLAEVGDRQFEGCFIAYSATLKQESGDTAGADKTYKEGLALLEAVGDRRRRGLFSATFGGLAAQLGRLDEAETLLDTADADLEAVGDVMGKRAAALHRGFVDIARDDRVAASARLQAELEHQQPLPSDDLRFALRMLSRALGEE